MRGPFCKSTTAVDERRRQRRVIDIRAPSEAFSAFYYTAYYDCREYKAVKATDFFAKIEESYIDLVNFSLVKTLCKVEEKA